MAFISYQLKQTLGTNLRKIRKEKKVHVSTICKKINKSSSYYYQLENGTLKTNDINPITIRRILDALNVEYDSNAALSPLTQLFIKSEK